MAGAPVLFLSYSGVLGGSERVLLDCASRLDRPVLLAAPEGPLAAAARTAGLAVAPLPNRSLRLRGARGVALRGLGGLALDCARLARRRRPPVLVAWGARAVLAAAVAPSAGTPVLAVHHDLLPGRDVAAAVRWATRRAAGALATSHAVARDLRRPAAVLHPGVDLAAWRPAPAPPPVPPRALMLGALVPWKRADLALEIAARVPELRLTVAGAPLTGDGAAYAGTLRRRADAPDLRGRVTFAGALADPRPALAAAHCLLHCADAEPFGMALVEALACGRPVVAPAAAGPLEIVGGGAGRLYAPGDPGAGAAAVRAILADPGAGAAARRRAEASFDVEVSAARFARAVEAVAR
jgi:glycosyltransferase involved in cell wall biosynthesis